MDDTPSPIRTNLTKPISWHSMRFLTLRWITYGLCEEYSLLGVQLKFLNRILFVAVVEPSRQTLRGSKQINVLGNETRVGIIIGFLYLRVSNRPIWLSGTQIVSSEVHDVEDIHWSYAAPVCLHALARKSLAMIGFRQWEIAS